MMIFFILFASLKSGYWDLRDWKLRECMDKIFFFKVEFILLYVI